MYLKSNTGASLLQVVVWDTQTFFANFDGEHFSDKLISSLFTTCFLVRLIFFTCKRQQGKQGSLTSMQRVCNITLAIIIYFRLKNRHSVFLYNIRNALLTCHIHFHRRREHCIASYQSTSPFCRTYLRGKPSSAKRASKKQSPTYFFPTLLNLSLCQELRAQ